MCRFGSLVFREHAAPGRQRMRLPTSLGDLPAHITHSTHRTRNPTVQYKVLVKDGDSSTRDKQALFTADAAHSGCAAPTLVCVFEMDSRVAAGSQVRQIDINSTCY